VTEEYKVVDHRDHKHEAYKKFRDWEGKRTGKFTYRTFGWSLSVLNGVTVQLSGPGETHWFMFEIDAQQWAQDHPIPTTT